MKNDSTKSRVGGGPIAPSDIGRQNRRWSALVEASQFEPPHAKHNATANGDERRAFAPRRVRLALTIHRILSGPNFPLRI